MIADLELYVVVDGNNRDEGGNRDDEAADSDIQLS